MEIFIAAIVFVGLSVFGMCFNIIFRKNGKFPETEISSNKEMRKIGIKCAKEDELKMWKKKGHETNASCTLDCSACSGCAETYGHPKEKR